MRNIFFSILLISMIGCFYSCEKDDTQDYTIIHLDPNSIAGVWCHSYEVDSLVLVFENETMKEYIFNKNTSEIMSRTDYGKYWLSEKIYNDGTMSTYMFLTKADSSTVFTTFTYYNLKEDQLSLYRNHTYINLQKMKN